MEVLYTHPHHTVFVWTLIALQDYSFFSPSSEDRKVCDMQQRSSARSEMEVMVICYSPCCQVFFSLYQVFFIFKCQNIVINPHHISPEVIQYKTTKYSISDDKKQRKATALEQGDVWCLA